MLICVFKHFKGVQFFLQTGAPFHVYGPVKERLDQKLNPCDFCLWRHIEYIAYKLPITSIEHLKNRIREAIRSINEKQ